MSESNFPRFTMFPVSVVNSKLQLLRQKAWKVKVTITTYFPAAYAKDTKATWDEFYMKKLLFSFFFFLSLSDYDSNNSIRFKEVASLF